MNNTMVDIAIEDVSDADWEGLGRYLAGDDVDSLEEHGIQGCCGACAFCDNCGAGWCTGLCGV